MKKLIAAGLIGLAGAASADPVTIMVGDQDNYGGSGINNSLTIPQDNRSAAEAAAVNGAQQTDFYSTLFTPLAQSFTMQFDFAGVVNSLSLDYRSFGLQASDFGPFTASANGINVTSLFTFQDGAFTDATHSSAFSAAVVAAVNAANGVLNMTISRSASNDAVAWDYFRVTADTNRVPEPSGLLLVGLGLVAALAIGRRPKKAR